MIEIYLGKIGGGKTYSAVKRMLEYISSGGLVISNIELHFEACVDYCKSVHGWDFLPAQYIRLRDDDSSMCLFHRQVPPGTAKKKVLVVIDEASEWLDSYESSKKLEELMTFLRQSRKVHIDIIFITQSLSLIHKRVRLLASWLWEFWDMRQFRLGGVMMAWPLDQILQRQFDSSGKPPCVRRNWLMKDQRIFKCYDTLQLYRDLGLSKDENVKTDFTQKKESKIWGEEIPMIWKIAFLVLAVFCGLQQRYYSSEFRRIEVAVKSRGVVVQPEVVTVKVKNEKKGQAVVAKASEVWKVDRKYVPFQAVGPNYVAVEGRRYTVGMMTPYGRVKALATDMILFDQANTETGLFWFVDWPEGAQEPQNAPGVVSGPVGVQRPVVAQMGRAG